MCLKKTRIYFDHETVLSYRPAPFRRQSLQKKICEEVALLRTVKYFAFKKRIVEFGFRMIWRIIQIGEDEIIHQGIEAEVDRDNILLYLYNSSHTNFCRGGSVFFL